MYTSFRRLVMVAALAGSTALVACDEAENEPVEMPDGREDALEARREGGVRPVDADGKMHDGKLNDGKMNDGKVVDGAHHDGTVADGKQPDNTAHNKGDGEGVDTVTPFDQSNAAEDIKVTADIRKAILGMEGMSTNADNVKVVTSADTIAIRGVVESQSEIDAIRKLVTDHAGTRKADIQLSVDPD